MARTPLTDVPYIGKSTEREFRKAIKSSRPTANFGSEVSVTEAAKRKYREILNVKLDKRQRKELGKASGAGELRFLTQEEKTERTRQQQSGSSTKSERKGLGDFMVNRSQQKEAFEQHQDRSARAKDVDNQRRATLTTNFELWSENPGRYDYPGIDTPSRKPRVQEDDKPFVEPDDFRRETDDMGVFGSAFEEESQEQPDEGNPANPPKMSQTFGEELMQTREERGNLAANAKYWEKTVREFEEEDMSVEFDEVTNIAGQTVVELGDFFEGDEGGVDAVVSGLTSRGAPVKGVEGTDRVRIDVSDEPRPIPYREREKSISGMFAEEL